MPSPDEILAARAHVPENVVYRSFEEETLLLNLDTGQYHGLNATGGRILELLEQTDGRVGEAVERLADECEIASEEIHDDMTTFFGELAKRGLIVVDEPSAG